MKRTFYLAIFSIFLSFGCAANKNLVQEERKFEQRRFFEETGGFSIIPPEPWQVINLPGIELKAISIDIRRNINTPIIIFFDISTFNGQLNTFVDSILEQLDNEYGENFVFLLRSDFVTLNNLKGEKIIFNLSLQGVPAGRQILYCFSGNDDRKIQAVGSVLEIAGDAFDEMFDNSMKTFEWTDFSANTNFLNKERNLDQNRFYEETGGFSIIPVEPWQIREYPGEIFKAVLLGNNAALINFKITSFNDELNEFVKIHLERLINSDIEGFMLMQTIDFVTLRNIKGKKTMISSVADGVHYRQVIYYFPGKGNTIFTATCAAYEEEGDTYNEIFDEIMRTFEWND